MSSKGAGAMKRKQPTPIEPKLQQPTVTQEIKRQKTNIPQPPATTKPTPLAPITKKTAVAVAPQAAKATPSPVSAGKKSAVSFAPAPTTSTKSKAPTPKHIETESEEEEEDIDDEDDFDFDEDMEGFEGEEGFDFDGFEGEFDDEDMEFDEDDEELPMYDDEEEEEEEEMNYGKRNKKNGRKPLLPIPPTHQYEETVGEGSHFLNIKPIKTDEQIVQSAAPKDGKFPSTFAESNLSPELKKALKSLKLIEPNKLQQSALGPLLHGKDVLTIAGPTSGKTINAILPALQLMLEAGWKQRNFTGCIILVPTRERALLTYQTVKQLTQFNPGITHSMVLGNTNPFIQFQRLQKGVSIIVATPERLLQQMLTPNSIFYKNAISFIIDDLDTMCDMGFDETIVKIAKKLDPLRHTICVSNTNTRAVQKIAKATMRNPLLIGCKTAQQQSMIKPADEKNFKNNNQKNAEILKQELTKFESINTNNYIQHGYLTVPTESRFNLLYSYIKKSLLKKTIIFVQTVDEVKHIVAMLRAFDIVTLSLHEEMSDVNKTKIFFEFQNAKLGAVMFVTELGLRGMKFTIPISTIIHYDNPINVVKYLQRLSHFPAISSASTTSKLNLNSILFVLKENEEETFNTTFSTKLTFTQFDPPKQLIDIFKETIKLTESNFFLHTSSLKAYFAFMRCYIQYGTDGTYDYKGVDKIALARSFGMQFPPAIKE